jgi:hypothetical protein
MALRGSWLFWSGLLVIVGGALLAALDASPALGIEFIALGYLLVLASMYRVGVRMYTRGGVITKQENIWVYRFSFLLLSVFGFGVLCIALSKSVEGLHSCHTAWCQIELLTMVASGLISLLLIASFAVAVVVSLFVWLVAIARGSGRSSRRSR